jgi:hypothetical protein
MVPNSPKEARTLAPATIHANAQLTDSETDEISRIAAKST